ERCYIEHMYGSLLLGPKMYEYYLEKGIYVFKGANEQGDKAYGVVLESSNAGFPEHSLLVVRVSALQELEASISSQKSDPRSDQPEGKKDNRDLRKRIEAVLAYARDRCPKGASQPKMADQIIAQQRNQRFSKSTIRQILSGRYPPMRKMGIEG